MKVIFVIALAAAVPLLSGCQGMGGAKPDEAAAAPASSGPAKLSGPTEAKVQVDREKNLADSDTFFVPTCVVKLAYAGKVAVSKSGSGLDQMARGGNANTVKASANYKVAGMDREFANSVAKAVCDDFVAKVRASGFKVTTWDDVKGQDWAQKAAVYSPDSSGFVMDGNYVLAAPSDAQNFKPGVGNSYIATFQSWGKAVYKEHMTLIVPSFTFDAPQIWGATESGVNRISAAINVAPGMNLTAAGAPILTQGGGWGGFKLKNYVVNVSEKVGEVTKEDTTSGAANTFSKTLGFLSGAGSITGKSANVTMTVDKGAYLQGAKNGAAKFNDEVAKVLSGLKKS